MLLRHGESRSSRSHTSKKEHCPSIFETHVIRRTFPQLQTSSTLTSDLRSNTLGSQLHPLFSLSTNFASSSSTAFRPLTFVPDFLGAKFQWRMRSRCVRHEFAASSTTSRRPCGGSANAMQISRIPCPRGFLLVDFLLLARSGHSAFTY